jgi:hypothetical protein
VPPSRDGLEPTEVVGAYMVQALNTQRFGRSRKSDRRTKFCLTAKIGGLGSISFTYKDDG